MISKLWRAGCLTAVAGFSLQPDRMEQHPQVFAWGLNSYGQLGIGSELSQSKPYHVQEFTQIRIKSISSSGISNSCAAVSSEGRVFTWGNGLDGVLGHPDTDGNFLIPTELSSLRDYNIHKVAVGTSNMAAITDDGRVLTWGLDDCGQCGHKQIVVPMNSKHYQPPVFKGGSAPDIVSGLEGRVVVDVSCGRHFTACATSDGSVYVWGSGGDYVLANGTRANAKAPVKVVALEGKRITSVRCGRNFVLALDDTGILYSWGRNDNGQLGQSTQDFYMTAPKPVSVLQDVVQMAVGDFHVVALTSNGKVFTWGAGADGQLGHGNRSNQFSPKQITDLPAISKVAAGGNHTTLLTSDLKLLAFGRGREGQLGRGIERESAASNRLTPQHVDFFKPGQVQDVSCGAEHTMVLAQI
mmetsp:Transcript_21004/g.38905  ORF Transcript_21004/g.38905 Transcript_21004/m.38905 type:complete len:411 (-) Transcript_21004:1165-2397(-)|eukprot:CAMPEP_0204901012 /NCGR_PEP_ID=MMETSP1397-20131031/2814_1 /ASSEMBLY_ACC=CAM_ASM_000891 /TAXON_ID=49980 /ORGANISM="Climacostomum Climacostomum virens, Strain Stock W-24" /LENGTH=410 /DNA_ID=CAMNT_0052069273 /DNA_START=633 /DNA_END=1865 /DNA_ORIENTATION=+